MRPRTPPRAERPDLLDDVRAHPLRSFVQFAVLAAIPVLVLGIVVARSLGGEADRLVFATAHQHVGGIVQASVGNLVGDTPFAQGLAAPALKGAAPHRLDDLRKVATQLLRRGTVMRLRLRGLDGSVAFDAAQPSALRVEASDADEAAEMAEVVEHGGLTKLTRLNADERDRASAGYDRAIEAYVPVAGPAGRTVGVVEVYLSYSPIAAIVGQTRNHLLARMAIGLTLLWLTLGLLVHITAKRLGRAVEHHRYVSRHDVLTELPNRVAFRHGAAAAIERARGSGRDVALAIIDLNGFRDINDTLGHHNGDAYLRHIGEQLQRALDGWAEVARLGGDEFGAVFTMESERLVDRLLDAVTVAVGSEVLLDSVPVSSEASIGLAVWPADGADVSALLRNADLALHAGKRERVPLRRYRSDIEQFSPERLSLVSEVRHAIAAGELVLHYQPKVALTGGACASVEALVRWCHPTRGMVLPGEFLPAVESTTLIDEFSRWVVRTAVAQLDEWSSMPLSGMSLPLSGMSLPMPPSIAVNLSSRNLRDESIADYILERLRLHGIDPSRLVVEITETDYLDDPLRSRAVLQRLRDGGVHASLDDFGQGFTSLAHLTSLPVSELKIDRGFVTQMLDDARARAVVESVIDLGHKLGLGVIAEGVERQDQLDLLTALGCDAAQGFLHSRPMAPEDVPDWLRRTAARDSMRALQRA